MSLDKTTETWKQVTQLDKPVSRHCTVQAKEDTIYIIGGLTESSSFSDKTISINILTKTSSTMRVKLNGGRQLHCCAMMNGNHILVVGGRDARGALKSVETLDLAKHLKNELKGKIWSFPLGSAMPRLLQQIHQVLKIVS
jgi:hypothetical protein